MNPPLVVIKLGGSLARSPLLARWLALLARQPADRARLVVPGGGPFADAVRLLEPDLGLDAGTAHRCAILAMQQYGLMLASRAPGLSLVEDELDVARLRLRAGAGVWLPWRMAGRSPELPASWDVTSDSIAAWLAARLRARALLVVKRAEAGGCLTALVRRGVLDPAFAAFARAVPRVRVVPAEPLPDPDTLAELTGPLQAGPPPSPSPPASPPGASFGRS
ncbi:hypothetical protein HRbin39_00655 [bacterium HR39]|nr:hypothetical protein HRbin39_00655 [bacterium HR39]